MKSKLLILPLALALAGAGCSSSTPEPVPQTPPTNVPVTAPATTTQTAPDAVIAVKRYDDPALGFSFTYPAEWRLDSSSGDIKLTNLGPDGDDFIIIHRSIGPSYTSSDSKFGDTTLRYDSASATWMITQPNENEDEVETVATPDFTTDTGLPVFGSLKRWASELVALSSDKIVEVNVSGSGWTDGLHPFVKTFSITGKGPTAAQINADMKEILDSEKSPQN
jgi:hypothetical protein